MQLFARTNKIWLFTLALLLSLTAIFSIQAAAIDGVAPEVTVHLCGTTPETPSTLQVQMKPHEDTPNAPLPDGAEGSAVLSLNAEESGNFGTVTFPAAGIYKYVVQMVDAGIPGYVYDSTSYLVTAYVDNSGQVQWTYQNRNTLVKLEKLEFWNSYHTPGTDVGDLMISVRVEGDVPKDTTFQYTVTFTGVDPDMTFIYTDEDGTVLGTIKSGDIITLTDGQKVYIKDIPVGTQWQTTQAPKAHCITDPITYIWRGTISTTLSKAPYVNRYDEDKAAPVSIDPSVEKQVTGTNAPKDSVFTFSMTQDTANAPMPDGSANGKKQMNITGPGSVEFGWMTYETTGTYSYTLSEVTGTLDGYTYDKSVYHMTVTVTDDSGILIAATQITKDGQGSTNKVLFVNRYTTGTPGGGSPGGNTSNQVVTSVNTGDTTTLLPYLLLMAASAFLIIILVYREVKK